MSERILVAYDGTDSARAAARYASVCHPGAELLILHFIEPFPDHTKAGGYPSEKHQQVYRQRQEQLNAAVALLDGHQGEVVTDLVYGRPAYEISRYAAKKDVDEVVMGSRGREGMPNLLLGSVSQAAVRRSPVPVTVVRAIEGESNIYESSPESVLVPFTGSARTRDALRYAFENFTDATVTALFVFATSSGAYVDIDSDADLEAAMNRDEGEKQIEDTHVLATAERVADRYGRDLRTASAGGNPIHETIRWTNEHDIDHLVLGREGQSAFRRLFLGDATVSIVRRCRLPVTVVP